MTTSNKPFFSPGGRTIDNIDVVTYPEGIYPNDLYIHFDNACLLIPAADAEDLIIKIATVLYDTGQLSMQTSEQLQYLSSSVLADAVYTGGE